MGRFPAWRAAFMVLELCTSLVLFTTGVYGQETLLQSLFFKDTQARLTPARPLIRGLKGSSVNDSTSPSSSSAESSTTETSHRSDGSSSTTTTSSAGKLNSNKTSTSAASYSNSGNSTASSTPSNHTKTTSTTNSKTTSTTDKVTDPGEPQTTFKRPLPPSYIYKDDDNAPNIVVNSPLNPVVDDISQFLDDNYNVTRKVLPPEKDPPSSWPLDVFAIFVGAAIVLFAATAYKNYKKRKAYTPVPSN